MARKKHDPETDAHSRRAFPSGKIQLEGLIERVAARLTSDPLFQPLYQHGFHHFILMPALVLLAFGGHRLAQYIDPCLGWVEWTEHWALKLMSLILMVYAFLVVVGSVIETLTGYRVLGRKRPR